MSYELTGKVKLVQEPQTFASGFTKREVVITVEDGQYAQDINLEFLQDKVSLLDNVSEGQELTATFDIRGREYNGRYFNNLVGWKLEGGEAAPAAAAPVAAPVAAPAAAPAPAAASAAPATNSRPPLPAAAEAPGEEDDDIPF